MRKVEERRLGDRLFEAGPGLYRVPVPTRFPVGDANVWILDAPSPVLVDAGVKGDETLSAIRDGLAALGRRIEDVRMILLTHGHVDHSGAAASLRALSGAPVYLSPRGHRRLSDPAGRLAEDLPRFLDLVRRSGFSAEVVDRVRLHAGAPQRFGDPCPDLLPLRDGDLVDAAGRSLEVIETPGHCTDHVVLFDRAAGVLLAGDHVLPHITANPILDIRAPERSALVEYRASLERVAALPARVVCPGHATAFTGLAERCRAIIEHQERRTARVLDIIVTSGPLTRRDLAIALFGDRAEKEVFLAISEVEAAVRLLAETGRVRLLDGGGVERVSAA